MLAILVAAACGGGEGDRVVTVGVVADATLSAESARLRIELSLGDGDGPSTFSEGVVDFESGDGEMRTGPLGSDLGDDAIVARTVDDDLFVGTANSGDEDFSWVRLPPLPTATVAMRPRLDPVSIADELARSSAKLTESGASEVEGDPTTVYRLDLPHGSDLLPSVGVVPADTSVTATMEVDNKRRLRRLEVEPDQPGRATDNDGGTPELLVPEHFELVLWDFGINVDVKEPPSDAIVDFDDPRADDVFAAMFEWPGGDDLLDPPTDAMPVPTGPFAVIASGQWEAVTWEVWQAPGSDGSVCHSVTLQPPPTGSVVGDSAKEAGVPSLSDSTGASSSCGPQADLFVHGDPVQVISGWSRDADYWSMIGIAAPDVASLRVELNEGEAIEVPVDPVSHAFALFHREPLSIEKIVPDAGESASIECVPQDEGGYVSFLNCTGVIAP